MSDKPGLTLDEPIATGWLRAEFYGDAEAAKGYLPQARRELGALRSRYGVNERIAQGEPGGYYRSSRVLPDGARIEAGTNDGHDFLRITVPAVTGESVASPDAQGEATSFEGAPTSYAFTPEPQARSEDKPVLPVASFRPYLWIGARIVSGREKDTANEKKLHVCVWEPSPAGVDPVILSNRNDLIPWADTGPLVKQPPDVYPLQYWDQFLPADDFQDGIAYTDDALIMIRPDNFYGIPMRAPDYDPAIDPDVEWDVMFISDPDNELGLEGMDGDMGGGEYMAKVMVFGPDCEPLASVEPVEVELRIIVGKDEWQTDDTTRFTITEFTKYRMGIAPKGWFGDQFGTPEDDCVACQQQANDYGDNPHGPHWWQGAAVAYVPPLQVDVPAEQLVPPSIYYSPNGEVLLPPTGFVPGSFPSRLERCGACATATTRFGAISEVAYIDDSSGTHRYFLDAISRSTDPVFTDYGLAHATTLVESDPPGPNTVSYDVFAGQTVEIPRLANYGAWYKYTEVIDKNNNIVSRTAQWISLAEYTAKPLSGYIETCTRAEQD